MARIGILKRTAGTATAVALLAGVSPSPAWARASDEGEWMFCSDTASGRVGSKIALIFVGPFRVPPEIADKVGLGTVMDEFEEEVGFDSVVPGYESFLTWGQTFKGCKTYSTQSAASSAMASRRSAARRDYGIIRTVDWRPSFEKLFELAKAEADASKSVESGKETEVVTDGPAIEPKIDPAEVARKAREQREAEFQAKLAEHEAGVAEYRRKVAEREAEIARQQKQQAAAEDAAAREKAAYEAKMAAHRRELDEANRRQQEYFAAQRRYALCVNGERQWCDDPAAAVEIADAGDASTDTDATTCVSRPVVTGNATFEGNTAAMVVNGCDTAVDVKICLMRDGGWNCGMVSGLQPQDRWSHSSFKASGEIFWDARVAGSNQPLGSPGSN